MNNYDYLGAKDYDYLFANYFQKIYLWNQLYSVLILSLYKHTDRQAHKLIYVFMPYFFSKYLGKVIQILEFF